MFAADFKRQAHYIKYNSYVLSPVDEQNHPVTAYVLTYHLHTGTGWWGGTAGFHVDLLDENNNVIVPDVLTAGKNYNRMEPAYHNVGMVPSEISASPTNPQFNYIDFDFTTSGAKYLGIRVDRAYNDANRC
jgi:hypothetical protein